MLSAARQIDVQLNQWFVLFDAVGTLIYPCPGAVETYFQIARVYGSKIDQATIGDRFRVERGKIFGGASSSPAVQPGQLFSTDEVEKQLWRRLIETVIEDVRPIDPLFDSLWKHFSQPAHWHVFSDVTPTLDILRRQNFRIGIASNFDSRVENVVASLQLLRPAEPLFHSTEVGFRKPDPNFYAEIESRLNVSPTRIVMIGDDWANDFQGPTAFGWTAIWLDRGTRHQSQAVAAGNRVDSLTQIPKTLRQIASAR